MIHVVNVAKAAGFILYRDVNYPVRRRIMYYEDYFTQIYQKNTKVQVLFRLLSAIFENTINSKNISLRRPKILAK
jgi:hypothetical protein